MPVGKSEGTPTLVTQLAPPSPPFGHVERRRLLERVERGLVEPVTLVCGPAGSGKTALLSSALGPGCAYPVAWVSLEPGDDDPAAFWRAVLASLTLAGAAAPRAALAAPAPPVRGSRPKFMPLLVHALAQPDAPLVLVLDDRHAPRPRRGPDDPS